MGESMEGQTRQPAQPSDPAPPTPPLGHRGNPCFRYCPGSRECQGEATKLPLLVSVCHAYFGSFARQLLH